MYTLYSMLPSSETPTECPDCGHTMAWYEAEREDKGVLVCLAAECVEEE